MSFAKADGLSSGLPRMTTERSATKRMKRRDRKRKGGRREMFFAVIQVSLGCGIINVGMFLAISFMKTISNWVDDSIDPSNSSHILAYRSKITASRAVYSFVTIIFGFSLLLIQLAVLMRIFLAGVNSFKRLLTADILIALTAVVFATLTGVHMLDAHGYPYERFGSSVPFWKSMYLTTKSRQEAGYKMSKIHKKMHCCGVFWPYEFQQSTRPKSKETGNSEYSGVALCGKEQKCDSLPDSCCASGYNCSLPFSRNSTEACYYQTGCIPQLSRLLEQHLLILFVAYLSVATVSIISIITLFNRRK